MVEAFSFGNFLSFKDIHTLRMFAEPSVDVLEAHTFKAGDAKLLKTKAIYGANASGKSVVLRAMVAFLRIVESSVKDNKILPMILNPFKLSTKTLKEPSFFQLIFWMEGTQYRYGFEVNREKVISEWLFANYEGKMAQLFTRKEMKIKINNQHFEEGKKLKRLLNEGDSLFRANSLLLTSLAYFGFGKLSSKIVDMIGSITVINGAYIDENHYKMAAIGLEDVHQKKFILNILKKSDIGIKGIEKIRVTREHLSEDTDEQFKKNFEEGDLILSKREQFNEDGEVVNSVPFLFDEREESGGTIKMFEFSSYFYNALEQGKTLFIDELDARLHPLLTKQIIGLFNSKENSKGAQLVFVTHDTNLLSPELLRRDQIDFVEKDKYGASHLYSLVEIKDVDNNSPFESDYIRGRYGAVPFLGDFSLLLDELNDGRKK